MRVRPHRQHAMPECRQPEPGSDEVAERNPPVAYRDVCPVLPPQHRKSRCTDAEWYFIRAGLDKEMVVRWRQVCLHLAFEQRYPEECLHLQSSIERDRLRVRMK